MAKVKHLLSAIFFLTTCLTGWSQYAVHYRSAGDDTSALSRTPLDTVFPSRNEAGLYIMKLPTLLRSRGFVAASVDSAEYDSASAQVLLYLGERYRWASMRTRNSDAEVLNAVRWPSTGFSGPMDFASVEGWQQKILDYLADNGHPFGKVYLDSIGMDHGSVSALLVVDEGPLYRIDSIRVYGTAKIKNEFLQRYLDIPNGSPYSQKKLVDISRRLANITYIQEERASDLTLLASGSVLNLYLKDKKTSQANVLIGFQPNSDQFSGSKKLLLTVDANVLLRNALGSGETIGLIWQQLQQKSPRLNLLFEQPYVFHSPFGLNFSLDMYKQDSLFLNIDMSLGTSYRLSERQTTTVFLQRRQTIVSGINTGSVIATRELPREGDVSSLNLGVGYSFNNTDFRFNPRRGNTFTLTASAGTKRIRKNNLILDLVDPNDPNFKFEHLYDTVKLKAYQVRVVITGEHFIPVGTQSTFKLGVNAGLYQSASYFRNELFQIGGFKLLRGFDEASQYVSQYAIGTIEYRYRLGLNSYFFAFGDGGWGKHLLETVKDHTYLGTGLGLSFETKAGIINLAWAVGKRDDTQLNLRQSKVHVGFSSYF